MQKKDVIYIDVEDDITAIIGKVKDAKEKIVALVPPKRTGVLQSAVNLRLLARTADNEKKRLVLITGNSALAGLAASAQIPVAKNLQSPPKLANVSSGKDDDEEDVIDGEQLPVGDHAGMKDDDGVEEIIVPEDLENIDVDNDATPKSDQTDKKAAKTGKKKRVAVPDFGTFRKKIALSSLVGALLIVFLFWAIKIAPHATIVVSAKTTDQALSVPVTLGADLTTDSEKAQLKVVTQTDKQTQSIDFIATGEKNVGERATGTVEFSTSSFFGLGTIPAGTSLRSSEGLLFTTDSAVTLTYTGGTSSSGTTTITAADRGEKYNGASGSMAGAPSGVSATLTGPTSGGTDKTVTVVTREDVDGVKDQLKEQDNNEARDKLAEKFDDKTIVIEGSFTATGGDPKSSPAIGGETASGKAKLTSEITYMMMGIPESEMNAYLDTVFEKTLTNSDRQQVFDNGLSTVQFSDFKFDEKTGKATATLTATAQIGPKIDDDEILEQSKGRRSGEVIGNIKTIDGVSDVNVKLSPFWVSGVPDDTTKITIEFKLITNG